MKKIKKSLDKVSRGVKLIHTYIHTGLRLFFKRKEGCYLVNYATLLMKGGKA